MSGQCQPCEQYKDCYVARETERAGKCFGMVTLLTRTVGPRFGPPRGGATDMMAVSGCVLGVGDDTPNMEGVGVGVVVANGARIECSPDLQKL